MEIGSGYFNSGVDLDNISYLELRVILLELFQV